MVGGLLFLSCGPIGVEGTNSSFIELVQARKFKEICRILHGSDRESAVQWIEEDSATTSPLITLCRQQPTVAVFKAVLSLTSVWRFDDEGRSVLHTAVRHRCSEAIMDAIVHHDADLVAVNDNNGQLALHYLMAAKWPHHGKQRMVAIAHVLMRAMPRGVIQKDNLGTTPFSLALSNKNMDHQLQEAMRLMVRVSGPLTKDRSHRTESTIPNNSKASEIPQQVMGEKDQDNDEDMSSIGSGGVSKHVKRANAKRMVI